MSDETSATTSASAEGRGRRFVSSRAERKAGGGSGSGSPTAAVGKVAARGAVTAANPPPPLPPPPELPPLLQSRPPGQKPEKPQQQINLAEELKQQQQKPQSQRQRQKSQQQQLQQRPVLIGDDAAVLVSPAEITLGPQPSRREAATATRMAVPPPPEDSVQPLDTVLQTRDDLVRFVTPLGRPHVGQPDLTGYVRLAGGPGFRAHLEAAVGGAAQIGQVVGSDLPSVLLHDVYGSGPHPERDPSNDPAVLFSTPARGWGAASIGAMPTGLRAASSHPSSVRGGSGGWMGNGVSVASSAGWPWVVQPCGLNNGPAKDGNLCFLNAATQLVLHAMPAMGRDLHRAAAGPAANAVRELAVHAAQHLCVSKEASLQYRSALRGKNLTLLQLVAEPGRDRQFQQDASELLQAVLHAVQEEMRTAALSVLSREDQLDLAEEQSQALLAAQELAVSLGLSAATCGVLGRLGNLRWRADVLGSARVSDSAPGPDDADAASFVGQMLTCTWDESRGQVTQYEFEPFNCWVLPVAGSWDGVALEELLRSYCREVSPEDRSHVRRRTCLWRLPSTLVLCLRRFDNACNKVNVAVRIPEVLDFSPDSGSSLMAPIGPIDVEEEGQDGPGGQGLGEACLFHTSGGGNEARCPAAEQRRRYHLTGVSYHLGETITSGHYIAAVRSASSGWWECNDNEITAAATADVVQGQLAGVRGSEGYEGASRTAYLLVYHMLS